MKAIIPVIILSLLFLNGLNAQDKKTHDPSYSVHNYKHPNKAKIAKEKNLDDLNYVQYNEPTKENYKARHNYKQQNNKRKSNNEGAIVNTKKVEKNTNSVFSKNNYKRQF